MCSQTWAATSKIQCALLTQDGLSYRYPRPRKERRQRNRPSQVNSPLHDLDPSSRSPRFMFAEKQTLPFAVATFHQAPRRRLRTQTTGNFSQYLEKTSSSSTELSTRACLFAFKGIRATSRYRNRASTPCSAKGPPLRVEASSRKSSSNRSPLERIRRNSAHTIRGRSERASRLWPQQWKADRSGGFT